MPEPENAIEVPLDRIDADTLRRLAEEFVTRDGTDYGHVEKTLEQKVEALLRQLSEGKAKVYFETESQTVNIVPARPIRARSHTERA